MTQVRGIGASLATPMPSNIASFTVPHKAVLGLVVMAQSCIVVNMCLQAQASLLRARILPQRIFVFNIIIHTAYCSTLVLVEPSTIIETMSRSRVNKANA